MSDLVQLNEQLVLSKAGFEDLIYEVGTLFKVMLVSNDHVVVKDDEEHTFILNNQDEGRTWSFL